jgi:hypothetical protein
MTCGDFGGKLWWLVGVLGWGTWLGWLVGFFFGWGISGWGGWLGFWLGCFGWGVSVGVLRLGCSVRDVWL